MTKALAGAVPTEHQPGQGFQLGQFGIVPIGQATFDPNAGFSPAAVAKAAPTPTPALAPYQAPQSQRDGEPLDVLKAARDRKRWLLGEVKRLRALERELEQINRLLGAATKKRAVVRDISQRRTG